jgi:class 3 adenylate cyclase/ligand-binding sensor domain-containing protein
LFQTKALSLRLFSLFKKVHLLLSLTHKREFLFCFVAITISFSAQSQSTHFRNFGIAEGLISSNVESVVQDSLGFIWVSSESGLSRYDGSSFTHYYSVVGDSTTLMNKSADNMHVDEEGRLWVGMRQGGLARYLPETDNFRNYAVAKTDTGEVYLSAAHFFSSDAEGSLIVRTVDQTTFRYDEAEDLFESYSPWSQITSENPAGPYPVFFDSKSRFWVSTMVNGAQYLKSYSMAGTDADEIKIQVHGFVNCAIESPEGILWLGTGGAGLYRYDLEGNSASRYFPDVSLDSLPGSFIQDLELDKEGNLWIATELGLAFINRGHLTRSGRDVSFSRAINSATGMEIAKPFKEIECDTGGRLWFTTMGGGLYLKDPRSMSYEFVTMTNGKDDEPLIINSVYEIEDSEGRQWYALGDSLLRYNPISHEKTFIDLEHNEKPEGGLRPVMNMSLAADERIMVNYQGGTFALLDANTLVQEYYPNKLKSTVPRGVLTSYRDSRGAMWVSTYHGVLRHPGTDFTVFDTIVWGYDGREIIEDQNGMIWVGSWNQGIIRIDPATLDIRSFDPNKSGDTGLMGRDAKKLAVSQDGRLWTLTSKGINFYNLETDRFEFVDLSANNELQLTDYFTSDINGNFWFSSLKGLFHWKRKTKKVMFLDSDFGLPQAEFYEIKSALDGNIYVSTSQGCLHFNPSLVPDPILPKEVFFTSLIYENESGEFKKSLLEQKEFQISHLENFVEINFASLNYELEGKIKYEYMLDGGSGVWVDIKQETKVSFLDITHGDYELKVRGRNDWKEYGPTSIISFSVSPPWWYSKVALVSYAILLVLSIVLYNRLRTYQLRRRQKLLEIIVEERTEEISLERDRSEALLLNILPSEVAEELKQSGQAQAKKIDHVTVLFTDFKGFTQYSEKVSPEALVEDLHESFTAFDQIMAKYGVEKIKTIGDAYMAAGGLPTPNETHPQDVLAAAFEIRDFIELGKAKKIKNGVPYFELRIGIHTGPVVAGIVGVKKFSYDIWGDTVNTASRMESSGKEGKVNISDATYESVKNMNQYQFEPRGKVKAKGKGELEMFFVENGK